MGKTRGSNPPYPLSVPMAYHRRRSRLERLRVAWHNMRQERRKFWGKIFATFIVFTLVSEYQANADLGLAFIGVMWSDVIADLTLAYRELKRQEDNTEQTKFQQ